MSWVFVVAPGLPLVVHGGYSRVLVRGRLTAAAFLLAAPALLLAAPALEGRLSGSDPRL